MKKQNKKRKTTTLQTKRKQKNSHNKFATNPGILYCFGATRGHSNQLKNKLKFTRRYVNVDVNSDVVHK